MLPQTPGHKILVKSILKNYVLIVLYIAYYMYIEEGREKCLSIYMYAP